MLLIRWSIIERLDLKTNRNLLFVFGDNMIRQGLGGQAASMRGEPNAFGIVTKMDPGMEDTSFFYDDNKTHWDYVNSDLANLDKEIKSGKYDGLVVPMAGLGGGLAQLHKTAPKLHKHLNSNWVERTAKDGILGHN